MTRKDQKKDTGAVRVTDEEWARRRLCSDGNCIGVVGAGGRCKECGLPYKGRLDAEDTNEAFPADADLDEGDDASDAPAYDDSEDAVSDPSAGVDDQDDADQAEDSDETTDTETDDEWAKRRLCRDGNCIGVIGPNGRCKECGLAWKSGKSGKPGKSD